MMLPSAREPLAPRRRQPWWPHGLAVPNPHPLIQAGTCLLPPPPDFLLDGYMTPQVCKPVSEETHDIWSSLGQDCVCFGPARCCVYHGHPAGGAVLQKPRSARVAGRGSDKWRHTASTRTQGWPLGRHPGRARCREQVPTCESPRGHAAWRGASSYRKDLWPVLDRKKLPWFCCSVPDRF